MLAAQNFLLPNGTFIAEVFAFLIVLLVLWRYVLPPLNKAMTDRQETIRRSLKDAEDARSEARETLARYRADLAQAREEALGIVEEAKRQGERSRQQIVARAEEEARGLVERARRDAGLERANAVLSLRREMGTLAVDLAGRIIGDGLDSDRQMRLVDRYIQDLETERPAGAGVSSRESQGADPG